MRGPPHQDWLSSWTFTQSPQVASLTLLRYAMAADLLATLTACSRSLQLQMTTVQLFGPLWPVDGTAPTSLRYSGVAFPETWLQCRHWPGSPRSLPLPPLQDACTLSPSSVLQNVASRKVSREVPIISFGIAWRNSARRAEGANFIVRLDHIGSSQSTRPAWASDAPLLRGPPVLRGALYSPAKPAARSPASVPAGSPAQPPATRPAAVAGASPTTVPPAAPLAPAASPVRPSASQRASPALTISPPHSPRLGAPNAGLRAPAPLKVPSPPSRTTAAASAKSRLRSSGFLPAPSRDQAGGRPPAAPSAAAAVSASATDASVRAPSVSQQPLPATAPPLLLRK